MNSTSQSSLAHCDQRLSADLDLALQLISRLDQDFGLTSHEDLLKIRDAVQTREHYSVFTPQTVTLPLCVVNSDAFPVDSSAGEARLVHHIPAPSTLLLLLLRGGLRGTLFNRTGPLSHDVGLIYILISVLICAEWIECGLVRVLTPLYRTRMTSSGAARRFTFAATGKRTKTRRVPLSDSFGTAPCYRRLICRRCHSTRAEDKRAYQETGQPGRVHWPRPVRQVRSRSVWCMCVRFPIRGCRILQKWIVKMGEDKYRCSLCTKLFMGPEFVRKHINLKHPQNAEEARKQVILLPLSLSLSGSVSVYCSFPTVYLRLRPRKSNSSSITSTTRRGQRRLRRELGRQAATKVTRMAASDAQAAAADAVRVLSLSLSLYLWSTLLTLLQEAEGIGEATGPSGRRLIADLRHRHLLRLRHAEGPQISLSSSCCAFHASPHYLICLQRTVRRAFHSAVRRPGRAPS